MSKSPAGTGASSRFRSFSSLFLARTHTGSAAPCRDRMSSNDVLGYFSIPLKEFALPFMVGVRVSFHVRAAVCAVCGVRCLETQSNCVGGE